MKLLVSTKRQFKMYLDGDLVDRLRNAASKHGRGSGQDIVEEILTLYLPVWTAVNDSVRRAVDYQTRNYAAEYEQKVIDISPKTQKIPVLKEKAK